MAAGIRGKLRVPDCSAIFFFDESVHKSKEENQRDSVQSNLLRCQCSSSRTHC